MEYHSRNTNTLAPIIYSALRNYGVVDQSRNGPVRRFPCPTTILIQMPNERVNNCPTRDANPFFHLWEALAMLAAYNSAPFMSWFAGQMGAYSDDGRTYNSFYGTRLRATWGDQLDGVVRELQRDPGSRQCVANLWDPADLGKDTKDKACNTQLMFSILHDQLHMTSINRSNDGIWGGVTGANIVHLSMFMEYVACAIGRVIGRWTHFSNNLHVYDSNPKTQVLLHPEYDVEDWYQTNPSQHRWIPLFGVPADREQFDGELLMLVIHAASLVDRKEPLPVETPFPLTNSFLARVAWPMFRAYHRFKHRETVADTEYAISILEQESEICDWTNAGKAWLLRRAM